MDSTLVEAGNPKSIAAAISTFYSQTPVRRPRRQSSMKQSPSSAAAPAQFKADGWNADEFNNANAPVGGRFGAEGRGPSEENFVVANATMWHTLWARLLDRSKSVKEFNGKKMWDIVVAEMA